jgi:hypothetical protein
MQGNGAEPNYISKVDIVGILIEYCYKSGRPQSIEGESEVRVPKRKGMILLVGVYWAIGHGKVMAAPYIPQLPTQITGR